MLPINFWVKAQKTMDNQEFMNALGRYTKMVNLNVEHKIAVKHLRSIFNSIKRSDYGKIVTARLLRKQKNICPYCVLPIKENYHIDHVRPISEGGHPFSWVNLAVAHPSCNLKKHASIDPVYFHKLINLKRLVRFERNLAD